MRGARGALLLQCLRHRERLPGLSATEWERLLGQAGIARLTGRLVDEYDATRIEAAAPSWLSDRIASARARARENERAIRWEVNRIARAFDGLGFRWVLLKGAGYVATGLPPGRGRSVADIDVLVSEQSLDAAEQALTRHGWDVAPLNDYDTRYYREWMHELPPMVHRERHSVVDLHHAILPRTSRLQPDSRVLMARAVAAGEGGIHVLCPTHMVLHAAAHLFHDGEVTGAIRDVVDLDALLRCFASADSGFWGALVQGAGELGLERPAYYALRYASRVLDTPVPLDVQQAVSAWAPSTVVGALMDRLVERALDPQAATGSVAAFALYVRSHWLKMPPSLLVRHLAHKALHRRTP